MTNRRDFLKTSSLAIGGLVLSNEVLKADNFQTPATGLRKRKSVNTLLSSDPDLVSYRRAVEVMKSRPATDPKGWEFQASIHNNFCPHGNWFFLPWHRAYLKYFEEICREASGNPDFNLPYWDWTEYPQIPSSFWGDNNPLNNSSRRITATSTASSEFIGRVVIQRVLNISSFEDFASYKANSPRDINGGGTGELEGTPHNYIHSFIGGNMATFLSPLDPIFWLHHANIDRLWATWNDSGKPNPDDINFKNFIFQNNFYNSNGTSVNVNVGDMFDVRAMGYIYDSQNSNPLAVSDISSFQFIEETKSFAENTSFTKKLKASNFELISSPFLTTDVKEIIESGKIQEAKKVVKVIINDIEPPKEEDFFVRVFLNCDYLDKNTPINDPHYVGSFTFFASNHNHSMEGGNMHNDHSMMQTKKLKFVLDISNTLSKIADISSIDSIADKIKVQLLPIPLGTKSAGKLLPGKIEIVVAEITN